MRIIFVFFIFIAAPSFGQKPAIQELQEINISYSLDSISSKKKWEEMETSEIEALQAEDAADLIQKLTGTSIKSYGGLGGLKTVSSRGLGAKHSAIIADGFNIQNTQNGQINLGQIHTDNITHISGGSARKPMLMLPVSAQVSGSIFLVETFENYFGNAGLQYRTLGKLGSFNQKGTYSALKFTNKKILLCAHGSFRNADGTYPYTIPNGDLTINGIRQNNDYQDNSFGATIGFKGRNSIVRMGYLQKNFNQGLPGAIIFYNTFSDERMTSGEQNIFVDYVLKKNKYFFRGFLKLNKNELLYKDPDYLGQIGGLQVRYENKTLQIGTSGGVELSENLKIHFGLEQVTSELNVSDSSFARPRRIHNYGLIGLTFNLKHQLHLKAQLAAQYITEENTVAGGEGEQFRLNPFIELTTKEFKHNLKLSLWYRSSFRMPTFNELYYKNIGNINLEPEEAHQINYTWSLLPIQKNNFEMYLRNNLYINLVENKIVAIPTQNLFVWSIQNIDKARVYGLDIKTGMEWKLSADWKAAMSASYSLQKALDITDRSAPTFRHQIAYIPLHTSNIDLSMNYRGAGIRFSNHLVSSRYCLNENIANNKVDGFLISSISAFYNLKLPNHHSINMRFTVKNLLDNSYAYMRSYVMPGRNYLIVMKYAFN